MSPVRTLITSMPAPWPVQTNLGELKIRQSFPLRPAKAEEAVRVEFVPEKTMLYKDCFIRQFSEFTQRNGCVLILQTRPRPVHKVIVDVEGDVVLNSIVAWRIVRYQLF